MKESKFDKKVKINFYIEQELLDDLKLYSKQHKVPMSLIIRIALSKYLGKYYNNLDI